MTIHIDSLETAAKQAAQAARLLTNAVKIARMTRGGVTATGVASILSNAEAVIAVVANRISGARIVRID
jgi:hypothetical protein